MSTAAAPSKTTNRDNPPGRDAQAPPTDLAIVDQPPVGGKSFPVKSQDSTQNALLFDRSKFEQAWSVAMMFSKSDLVPQHFKGKPENCFIACQLAYRFGMDPFMVMQNTYVVHGRPGFEGKFVIALVNSSGLFLDPLEFSFEGEPESSQWLVRVSAERAKTGKKCEMVFRYRTAEAEGWVKGNPKWRSMPEQMMMYRGATFFARVYCPEVLMGMRATEELEDIVGSEPTGLETLPAGRSSFREPAQSPAQLESLKAAAAQGFAQESANENTDGAVKIGDVIDGELAKATANRKPVDLDAENAKLKAKREQAKEAPPTDRKRWPMTDRDTPAMPGYFRWPLVGLANAWLSQHEADAHGNTGEDLVQRLEDGMGKVTRIPGPQETAKGKVSDVAKLYQAAKAEMEAVPGGWSEYVVPQE